LQVLDGGNDEEISNYQVSTARYDRFVAKEENGEEEREEEGEA